MPYRPCRFRIQLVFTVFVLCSLVVSFISMKTLSQGRSIVYPCDSTRSKETSLAENLVIFVRTSFNCQSRLTYLLQSWISGDLLRRRNLYLLTDDRTKYSEPALLDHFPHVVETKCPNTHNRMDLCCKTAKEFDLFYEIVEYRKEIRWLCRFDDDQYLNEKNLLDYLATFNASEPLYIGRTSITNRLKLEKSNRTFAFATYGAGVCFSRALLEAVRPWLNRTNLPQQCEARGLSDDAFIGYLVEILFNVSLISNRKLFHSHLEQLDQSFRRFTLDDLTRSITLGFAWDRYKLDWLPIIHQLIELVREDRLASANRLWSFLRTYEEQHPENLRDQYDQSCLSYREQRQKMLNKTFVHSSVNKTRKI